MSAHPRPWPEPAELDAAVADVAARLCTPALVIDLDAVAHNTAAMIARASVARWRPHIKTVKQARILEVLLEAGVRRFKCATAAELRLLLRTADAASAGDVDVLLAYPPTPPVLAEVDGLRAGREDRIAVLADRPDHLRWLATAAGGRRWRTYLDVDLGMGRTGTAPEGWRDVAVPDGAEIVGLHGYDGHRRWEERDPAHVGYDALCELAEHLGLGPEATLVTSGTHSYAHALAHRGLASGPWGHQVSPGTIVLSDLRSAPAAADLGLRQAAFVVGRVVSTPRPDRITLDAGSKAIAPDCPAPTCALLGYPQLRPLTPSEEHLPVQCTPGTPAPEPGALVWLVPAHVCTTVNLHATALYVQGGRVVGTGPVQARGHRPFFAGEVVS
jgi:D-serine deaminase-like pyridoxal phosphate-dependent protein